MNNHGEIQGLDPIEGVRRELSPTASSFVVETLEKLLLDGLTDGTTTVVAEENGTYTAAQWETPDHAARITQTVLETSQGSILTTYLITYGDATHELRCAADGTVTTLRGSLTGEDVSWLPRLLEAQALEKLERDYLLKMAEAVDGKSLYSRKKESLFRRKLQEMSRIGVASPMGTITTEQDRQKKNPLHCFQGGYREGVDRPSKFPVYNKQGNMFGYEVWALHTVVAEERHDEVQNIEAVYKRLLDQADREVDKERVDILSKIAISRRRLITYSGTLHYNEIAHRRVTAEPHWDDTHVVIPMDNEEGARSQNMFHVFSLEAMRVTDFQELLARQL